MSKHLWAAAAALVFLMGCDQAEEDFVFKVSPDLTADQAAAIQQSLEIFQRECPLVFEHWRDVDRATASFHRVVAPIYRTETLGWTNEVRLELVIAGQPHSIPGDIDASGHRLTYYLGGGRSPGILAKKTQAKQLCPMPAGGGEDSPKPVAELAFLDSV